MRWGIPSLLALSVCCSASSFTIRKASLPTGALSHSRLVSTQLASGNTIIKNDQELGYYIDVLAGGNNFTVVLDTGSSDLWLAPRPGVNYNQTFTNAKIFNDLYLNFTYGSGSVEGYVAQLDGIGFAGYTVNNQTLLYVTKQDEIFDEIEAEDPTFGGIAGIGFDTISQIADAVTNATRDTWGRTLLSNVFLANPTLPNHLAIFLDRLGYLNDTGTGTFDIGTVASGYDAVVNQPKHDVFTGLKDRGIFQWNLLMSDLKINGQSQPLKTEVVANKSTGLTDVPPTGSVSALLDTGSTLGQLPPSAWKVLYEGMGGVLVNNLSYTGGALSYAVPCMAEAQLEMTFGNQTILIHPLDLTNLSIVTTPDNRNVTACLSYFEPGSWYGNDNDLVLGDAFLRNVYALYDFGTLNSTLSGLGGNPFIQLLPLTNASQASSEFKEARKNALSFFPPEVNISTINDPMPQTMSGSSGSSGSSNSADAMISFSNLLPVFATIVLIAFGVTLV